MVESASMTIAIGPKNDLTISQVFSKLLIYSKNPHFIHSQKLGIYIKILKIG